ncbi:MAG: response regulator [Deltaproteobacteria bacterium]|jgi:CheY-like chemotaxis protein|nr:response regulator [Deltaproteobacteria bacterium]MCW8893328.1 response regulator [Deltaproteobacteria bacterium]MCW9048940.1 response regulator [Deltaproteobacteria bacterium]
MKTTECSVSKKHILFVDDEESLARLGADLLEDFGYQIVCALSGQEALRLFQQEAGFFDIVITDESMPGMSGIELAQEIYRVSVTTPVILCSGHMLTMQEEGIEQTNITAVLAKTDVCTKLPGMLEKIF